VSEVSVVTGNKRLLVLADFLEKLPRKRFDYKSWVGQDWGGAPDLSCGTTACALGWAAVMPEFRRLGLRLVEGEWAGAGPYRWVVRDHHVVNKKTGSEGAAAGEEIFSLNWEEAVFVFNPNNWYDDEKSPDTDATPKQVAKHIRKFVAGRAA
jgi:hypothetical protein